MIYTPQANITFVADAIIIVFQNIKSLIKLIHYN
ncbi:hypothetical protein FLBR109950_06575 [Flavobacterium branchiophilum]